MAPKRKSRAASTRQAKRGKVDIADYSAWGWVGLDVLKLEQITRAHLMIAYGFSSHGKVFHPCKYTTETAGEDEDTAVVVVEENICDKKACRKDPLCTNFLGQEKWENAVDSKKRGPKRRGAREYPENLMRIKSIPVGLENLGATCYANAFLQVWYQNSAFRGGIYACRPTSSETQTFRESPIFQLQVTFAALQCSNRSTYNPTKLVESLRLNAAEQQDAQEFSKLFLSHLEGELRKQEDTNLQGLITSQFEGRQRYITVCQECKRQSSRDSPFLELELALEPDTTLETRISSLLSQELLNGDNQYFCSACDGLKDATRHCELVDFPPVLHFSLLRFVFDPKTMERKKSKHAISFPERINLAQFLGAHNEQQDESETVERPKQMYTLQGVLLHKGASAYHGHYESEIYDMKAKKWFTFNDETVTELKNPFASKKDDSLGRMQSKDAYMLVYVRETIRSMDQVHVTPPPMAMEEIERSNTDLNEEIAKHREKEAAISAQFEDLRQTVQNAYCSWTPSTVEKPTMIVSRQALETWLSSTLKDASQLSADAKTEKKAEVIVIPNDNIICEHRKLDPLKSSDMKCISDISGIIKTGYEVKPPPFSVDDVCEHCVQVEFTERLYKQQHPDQVAEFDAVDEDVDEFSMDNGTWVSKSWLKDWRSTRPNMHVAAEGDPPPDHVDFIHDIVCEHGGLTFDASRRRLLCTAAACVLRSIFPQWSPIAELEVCAVCEEAATEAGVHSGEMKQLAAVEKAALKQLLDHTIDNKSVLVEDTDYAVVPAPFVRAWKRWALRPSSNDRPTHIDTAQFLCEHDGLVLDLTMASDWSNVFTLIKFGHWEGLIQHYTHGPVILARQEHDGDLSTSPRWSTQPAVCPTCRIARRLAYDETEIAVRVIREELRLFGKLQADDTPSNATRRLPQRQTRAAGYVKKVAITPTMSVKDLKLKLQELLQVSIIAQRIFHDGVELTDNEVTMVGAHVLSGAELELRVVKEGISNLKGDVDVDMLDAGSSRTEGAAFEGTLLGSTTLGSTSESESDMRVDSEEMGLTCPACTYNGNALDADTCAMCGTPLD